MLRRGEGRQGGGVGGWDRGTGSKGENNPPWPGRNSPVLFPAGSLTSYCVCMDMRVCVSCRPFLSGECGGSFSPRCSLTAGTKMRWIYV